MDMNKMIEETKSLIADQLALQPDNMVEEQYKSRTISNYAMTLKTLIDIKKGEGMNG